MKTIVIQSALAFELQPVLDALAASTTKTGITFKTQVSGMGKDLAGKAALNALREWRPQLLVDFGIAGSLAPELQIGDVVLGTGIIDTDVGHVLPTVIGTQDTHFSTLKIPGLRVYQGTTACTQEIVSDTKHRLEMHKTTGALAVCWEPYAMAQACVDNKVPFLSMRVISDTKPLSGDLKKIIQELKNNVRDSLPVAARALVDALNS